MKMIRVRLAGVLPMGNGFAFMHRTNVKHHEPYDYYTFPAAVLEEKETYEESCIREIKEEFGIDVTVGKLLYHIEKDQADEYFYLCNYESGYMGTGTGPEFSGNPKYADRGNYLPEIFAKEIVKDILLLPPEVKEMLVEDIEKGVFDLYFREEK